MAVQTLRNWILASTFLATVSITIAFGLLSFIVQIARVIDPVPDTLIYQLVYDPIITQKTLVILTFNFIAFFVSSSLDSTNQNSLFHNPSDTLITVVLQWPFQC